jgi:hypothetical protein
MEFPVLIKPGFDVEGGRDLLPQLGVLENTYWEACYALLGFSSSQKNDPEVNANEEYQLTVLRREIVEGLHGNAFHPLSLEDELEVARRLNIHLLGSGRLPKSVQRASEMIYAKSFLYALDGFEKMLRVLKELGTVPCALKEVHEIFIKEKFVNLTKVRNSAHHEEDRVRGLKSEKRKLVEIIPEPYAGGGLLAGMAGVPIYVVSSLMGNNFTASIDDGHVATVEVSFDSLVKMRDSLQQVYDSFKWKGSPQVLP